MSCEDLTTSLGCGKEVPLGVPYQIPVPYKYRYPPTCRVVGRQGIYIPQPAVHIVRRFVSGTFRPGALYFVD